ncbi:1,4-beta-xylanase, partial [Clostridium perfringens]
MSNTHRNEPRLKEMFADDFLIGAAVNPRTIETQEELLS